MKDFAIQLEISKSVQLSDVIDVIGFSMGLDITLNEGYKEESYSEEEINELIISKTFDINKPVEKGNFAPYNSITQFEVNQKINAYVNKQTMESFFTVEDAVGQINIFSEKNPFYGKNKTISVKNSDAYSFFIMSKVVKIFGGVLKLDSEPVINVSENEAVLKIEKEVIDSLNFNKEKTGFNLIDLSYSENESDKNKFNEILKRITEIMNDRDIKKTKVMLELKGPSLETEKDYSFLNNILDMSRLKKIAAFENKNKVYVQDFDNSLDLIIEHNRMEEEKDSNSLSETRLEAANRIRRLTTRRVK